MKSYLIGPLQFDSDDRLLRRGEEILELPAKTADVLFVLLANAGKLVPREALRQEVWGSTHTEEDNLSKNISILRSVLRSHIGDQEFIRTLPKRGYQFVASVTLVSVVRDAVETDDCRDEEKVVSQRDFAEESAVVRLFRQTSTKRWRFIGFISVIAIFLVFGSIKTAPTHLRALAIGRSITSRPCLAVVEFRNLSDDSFQDWLGPAFGNLLDTNLSRSPGVQLVSQELLVQTTQEMALGPVRVLDEATVQAVGRRLNCNLILVGYYLPIKDTIRVDLQLRSAETGKAVATFSKVSSLDGLFQTEEDASLSFRTYLALTNDPHSTSRPGISRQEEMQDAYSSGVRLLSQAQPMSAQPFLYKAALLSPMSSQVHAALAHDWHLLGNRKRAMSEFQVALKTASSTSQEERLATEAESYAISFDWPRTQNAYNILHRKYPTNRDYAVGHATALAQSGRAQEAINELEAISASSESAASDPNVLSAEALAAFNLSDWRQLLLYAGKLRSQAEAIHSSFFTVRALIWEGDAWSYLGDSLKARASFRRAGEISTVTDDLQGLSHVFVSDGNYQLSHHNQAGFLAYRRALNVDMFLGDLVHASWTLNNIGSAFLSLEDWGDARESYQRGIELAIKGNMPLGQIFLSTNLAVADSTVDRLDEAYTEANLAVSLSQKVSSPTELLESRTILGDIEMTRGNLLAAQDQYEKALQSAKTTGDNYRLAKEEGNLALCEMAAGNLASSRSLIDHAIGLHGYVTDSTDLLEIDAALRIEEGDPKAATEQMMVLLKNPATGSEDSRVWRLLAESWLIRGDLANARAASLHALELASRSPETHTFLLPASITAARIDAASGNSNKASNELAILLTKANDIKDVPIELEIRLAQGQIKRAEERKSGRFDESSRALQLVRDDARKHGFLLISKKADKALKSL